MRNNQMTYEMITDPNKWLQTDKWIRTTTIKERLEVYTEYDCEFSKHLHWCPYTLETCDFCPRGIKKAH